MRDEINIGSVFSADVERAARTQEHHNVSITLAGMSNVSSKFKVAFSQKGLRGLPGNFKPGLRGISDWCRGSKASGPCV